MAFPLTFMTSFRRRQTRERTLLQWFARLTATKMRSDGRVTRLASQTTVGPTGPEAWS